MLYICPWKFQAKHFAKMSQLFWTLCKTFKLKQKLLLKQFTLAQSWGFWRRNKRLMAHPLGNLNLPPVLASVWLCTHTHSYKHNKKTNPILSGKKKKKKKEMFLLMHSLHENLMIYTVYIYLYIYKQQQNTTVSIQKYEFSIL